MKAKNSKLKITALLALTFLLLAGCANVEMPPPEVSEGKTTSQIFSELAESLPETDEFRGETLTILTPDKEVILGDENAAGSVRGALKNRNTLITSVYEMEVAAVQIGEDEIAENLKAAVTAGTPIEGDILCYSAQTTVRLWEEGLLADMTDLPYFDVNKVCSDPRAATALMTGQSLYLLPDPSAHSYDDAYVLFYDRTLVRGTGLPLPETEVNAGTWDIETFQRYTETVAASVMDRTSYDLSVDVFGYSSPDNTDLLPYLLWCAQGYELFVNPEAGAMAYAYDAEALTAMARPLIGLYASKSRFPLDGEDAYTAFREGRLGFLVAKLGYLKELYATSTREYGILPLPTANGGGNGYVCSVDTTGRVLSVPALMHNQNRSGLGLTAVCAAGGSLLHAAEKQTYVTLYALDNDQSCMLETILDAARFDFGSLYAPLDDSINWLSTKMVTDVVISGSQFHSFLRDFLENFGEYAAENLC